MGVGFGVGAGVGLGVGDGIGVALGVGEGTAIGGGVPDGFASASSLAFLASGSSMRKMKMIATRNTTPTTAYWICFFRLSPAVAAAPVGLGFGVGRFTAEAGAEDEPAAATAGFCGASDGRCGAAAASGGDGAS